MNTCQFTDSSGTFSRGSLVISDDRKDTVNVTIKKLEMRDAGWYLCIAGTRQMAVQVLVKERANPATTLNSQAGRLQTVEDGKAGTTFIYGKFKVSQCTIWDAP